MASNGQPCLNCGSILDAGRSPVRVGGKHWYCAACAPLCCMCRRPAAASPPEELDQWRVNGFLINNRQFICGDCDWPGQLRKALAMEGDSALHPRQDA
ncbi:MAG: hypothetical protein HY683_09585 [Chloroflexi bacterium]|nr:hypothetical protein [Chloroflexota bacterium]